MATHIKIEINKHIREGVCHHWEPGDVSRQVRCTPGKVGGLLDQLARTLPCGVVTSMKQHFFLRLRFPLAV